MNLRRITGSIVLATYTVLCGCASTEIKLSPAAANSNVVVRFARGDALMLSSGRSGAVALMPVRYSGNTNRTLFVLSGYNHSMEPINFGPEDVSMTLDDGTPLPVFDFDHVRHDNKVLAERQRVLATVALGVELYAASGDHRHGGRRANPAAERAALSTYDERLHSIADTLAYRTRRARQILETTTLDPGTYWSGWVVGPEPALAEGQTRRVDVTVRLAGETHRFALLVAAEGTPTPVQADLPAAPRRDAELVISGTPSTWLWNVPTASAFPQDTREETVVYVGPPH